MTAAECQAAAVRVLIRLAPAKAHQERCPAWKSPSFTPQPPPVPDDCNCFVIQYVRIQVKALDDAGLLCALVEEAS